MWRNPEWVLHRNTIGYWAFLTRLPLGRRSFPRIDPKDSTQRALDMLAQVHDRLVRYVPASVPAGMAPLRPGVSREFQEMVFQTVQDIESKQQYSLVSELWAATLDLARMAPIKEVAIGATAFAWAVRLLLGDESRILVGTRDDVPAWKPFAKRLRSEQDVLNVEKVFRMGSEMRYIFPQDVDLVPAEDEWAVNVFRRKWPPLESMQLVRDLFEQAHCNRRFVVHHDGAEVLVNLQHLPSLRLKVRRGVNDPNYYDFLARFELDEGSFFVVLDGTFGTDPSVEIPPLEENGFHAFAFFLMAQIYHDLVTAIRIPYTPPEDNGKKKGGGTDHDPPSGDPPPEESRPIPIPRFVYVGPREPRIPIPTPKIFKPRRVTGYFRDGKPSERHLQEIREFEQEYGLKVFPLPDGQNFWRPHVSPKATPEEFLREPRFIRFRLQEEIDEKRQEAIEASRRRLAPP